MATPSRHVAGRAPPALTPLFLLLSFCATATGFSVAYSAPRTSPLNAAAARAGAYENGCTALQVRPGAPQSFRTQPGA